VVEVRGVLIGDTEGLERSVWFHGKREAAEDLPEEQKEISVKNPGEKEGC
jgi:hypothetical protein